MSWLLLSLSTAQIGACPGYCCWLSTFFPKWCVSWLSTAGVSKWCVSWLFSPHSLSAAQIGACPGYCSALRQIVRVLAFPFPFRCAKLCVSWLSYVLAFLCPGFPTSLAFALPPHSNGACPGFPHTRFSLHKSVRVLAIAVLTQMVRVLAFHSASLKWCVSWLFRVLAIAAGDAAFVALNCACPGFPLTGYPPHSLLLCRLTQMVGVLAFPTLRVLAFPTLAFRCTNRCVSWLLLLVTPRSLRQIVRVLAFPRSCW